LKRSHLSCGNSRTSAADALILRFRRRRWRRREVDRVVAAARLARIVCARALTQAFACGRRRWRRLRRRRRRWRWRLGRGRRRGWFCRHVLLLELEMVARFRRRRRAVLHVAVGFESRSLPQCLHLIAAAFTVSAQNGQAFSSLEGAFGAGAVGRFALPSSHFCRISCV
jgi:hypothetical protein